MAINPNNELSCLHTAYTARSGKGKGVAFQLAGFVPKKPCLAIFDPYKEYVFTQGQKMSGFAGNKVWQYKTKRGFAHAFLRAWQSGKHFYLAFTPDSPSRADMLWFCELMWQAGDGNRRLDVAIEELAKYSLGSGAEPMGSSLGELATGGRKFGIVLHLIYQTPTEVSKSMVKQMEYVVAGGQSAMIECNRIASEIDKTAADVGRLKKCTYWVKYPEFGDVRFLDLRGKVEKLIGKKLSD